jgi:hypothetical protein
LQAFEARDIARAVDGIACLTARHKGVINLLSMSTLRTRERARAREIECERERERERERANGTNDARVRSPQIFSMHIKVCIDGDTCMQTEI